MTAETQEATTTELYRLRFFSTLSMTTRLGGRVHIDRRRADDGTETREVSDEGRWLW